MFMSFNISMNEEGQGNLTVFENGRVVTINAEDPNFINYVSGLKEGKTLAEIRDEINPYAIVELTPLLTLHQDKTTGDEKLFFDGETIDPILEATILRYHRQGRSFDNLVCFLERLAKNTDAESREFLYQWATVSGLKITSDGYLLGWRGLNPEGKSIHTGEAYVDGVLHTGNIPNPVGSVIHMNREDCEADPSVSCGSGLHVGSESYATGWGQGNVVYVKVDPRDVVSVPDHDCEKMRVCRFTVIDHVTQVEVDLEPAEDEAKSEKLLGSATDLIQSKVEDSTTLKKWVGKIQSIMKKHA